MLKLGYLLIHSSSLYIMNNSRVIMLLEDPQIWNIAISELFFGLFRLELINILFSLPSKLMSRVIFPGS